MASYKPFLLVFAEPGFKLLFVNYPGSTNMNREQLEYICGKVGHSDVANVAHAMKHYADDGEIDDQRISLVGASHRGFIVTHLIGQCGDDFQFNSCFASNPVTDYSIGVATSDSPDFSYNLAFGRVDSIHPFEIMNDLDLV